MVPVNNINYSSKCLIIFFGKNYRSIVRTYRYVWSNGRRRLFFMSAKFLQIRASYYVEILLIYRNRVDEFTIIFVLILKNISLYFLSCPHTPLYQIKNTIPYYKGVNTLCIYFSEYHCHMCGIFWGYRIIVILFAYVILYTVYMNMIFVRL